jgi:hypothetical protein
MPLAESHTNNDADNWSYNGAYYDHLSVRVREARAWFRGHICMFLSLILIQCVFSVSHLDEVNWFDVLGHLDSEVSTSIRTWVNRGQTVLHYIENGYTQGIHAEGGDGLHRGLAFAVIYSAPCVLVTLHNPCGVCASLCRLHMIFSQSVNYCESTWSLCDFVPI